MEIEVYGTAEQQRFLRRARALYDLLKADPRYGYYGRGVGVLRSADAPFETAMRLAQVQGATNFGHVPMEQLAELKTKAEGYGLGTTVFRRWGAENSVVSKAREIIERYPLPDSYTLVSLGVETPLSDMEALADAAGSVGVLTLCGDVQRGIAKPAMTLILKDGGGRVISCAASASYAHPSDGEFGRECWWGMLVTREEARGQKLSLALGARVLVEMVERHGFERIFTGVQDGNAASEAVCTRVGLEPHDTFVLTMADPSALPGGKMTR